MNNCRRRTARRRVRQHNRNQLTLAQKQTLRNALYKQVRKGVKSIHILAEWIRAAAKEVKMIKSVLVDRGRVLLKLREGNIEREVRLTFNEIVAFCN